MSISRAFAIAACAALLPVVSVARAQNQAAPKSGAPPAMAAPPAAAPPAAAPAAAAPAGAVAEVPPASPCANDVDVFCKGITPGGGDVLRCLADNGEQLSSTCRQHLAALKSTFMASAADCEPDVQKFCASVPRKGGRVVQCLQKHAKDLTPACGALRTKLMAAAGSPGTPAAAAPAAAAPSAAAPAAAPAAPPPAKK